MLGSPLPPVLKSWSESFAMLERIFEAALLRGALAKLNDVVLVTEAEPIDLPGPRIVYVNEAFERMTGFAASDVIGSTPRIL